MQAKEIIAKGKGHEFAVISPSAYVGRGQRAQASRSQCYQAKLVSTTKHQKTSRRSASISDFTVADSSDRSAGFLVENAGTFFVAPAQDFIEDWSVADARWTAEESVRATEMAEQNRRSSIREVEENRLRAVQDSLRQNLITSLKGLLGDATPVSVSLAVDGKWNEDYTVYNAYNSGSVSISVRDFQRLLETVYEARELADA
jgi:hypothetical protein